MHNILDYYNNIIYNLYTLDYVFFRSVDFFPENFTGIIESSDGCKIWNLNGQIHRIEGPAVICDDGYQAYWIDGKQVTELEHHLLYDLMKLKGLI